MNLNLNLNLALNLALNLNLKQGAVLADHVKNLDWRARRAEKKAVVEPAVLSEVLGKLGTLLDA